MQFKIWNFKFQTTLCGWDHGPWFPDGDRPFPRKHFEQGQARTVPVREANTYRPTSPTGTWSATPRQPPATRTTFQCPAKDGNWVQDMAHTYFHDGWNLIRERVANAFGEVRTLD